MNTRKRKYDQQANGSGGGQGGSERRASEERKENSGSIASRRSPRIRKEVRVVVDDDGDDEESRSLSVSLAIQESDNNNNNNNDDEQEERIQLDKKLKAERGTVGERNDESDSSTSKLKRVSDPASYQSTPDSQPSTIVLLASSNAEFINSLPRTTVTLASSSAPFYSASNPDMISSSTKYHSNFSDSEEDDENKTDANSNVSNNIKSKSNIAILNKTKINTEYIAKILPPHNSQGNDPRYDINEINKLRLLSHSYQNFAVKLLTRLFDEEEIIGRNVYGRNYSGDRNVKKQPLDPARIEFIKETVLRLTKTSNPELAWASCVIAMNRKMVDINNKYQKIAGDK